MMDMTKGSEFRLIILFSIPMLFGNIFQQFYNVFDSIIVGQAIGKGALAAVGASFPVLFLLIALIMGISMGTTVLISQYYGAKDMEKVKLTIETSYIFIFVMSLIMTFLGLSSSGYVLRLMNTPPDVFDNAKLFLDVMFAGLIFLFGYNSISAVLRGLGDSKTPLYLLIASTIINIILELLFVIVFRFGIFGAAVATVIAQGVSFIGGIYYLKKANPILVPKLREIRFDREIFRLSVNIGLPSGMQQMLVAAGMMALTRLVNNHGTDAIAAFTAAGRIDAFAMMPAMNMSMAVSTFAGQNIGAGLTDRVWKGLRATLLIATAISVIISIIVIFAGDHLISMFTSDQGVITIGRSYLTIVGAFYIIFTIMFIFNGALRGAGDTLIPMFVTLIALWLVRIPASAFLSWRIGTDGIWWGVPIGWLVGATLSTMYYATGRWKKKAGYLKNSPAEIEKQSIIDGLECAECEIKEYRQ